MILGIDVGGTTVKFGVVDFDGEILHKEAVDTHAWDKSNVLFVSQLIEKIKSLRNQYEITGVGIGLPGLLTPDRIGTITLANIPCLNHTPIVSWIQKEITDIPVKIENDAKCAALGEIYFGDHKDLQDYLMIALGTGVGGGLVLNRHLFIGPKGNATEIGHIPVSNGKTLEDNVGQERLTAHTYEVLKLTQFKESSLQGLTLNPKVIFEHAQKGDSCARFVFEEAGLYIADMLVGVMRLIDIETFILAGGVAGAFEFIKPGLINRLKELLPDYYTNNLDIRKASLKTEAGILGAASLIMHEHQTVGAHQ